MSKLYTSENLKDVLSFPFKDEEWPAKLLILFLLSFGGFLIVPIFFVAGYQYEIMRQIIVDREEPSLPEWEDWGTLFKNGAKFWAVTLIYFLPLFALFIILFGLIVLAGIGIGSLDQSSSQVLPFFFFIVLLLWSLVGTISFNAMSIISIAASGHMIAKGEFAAAFQIKAWWPILKKSFWGFVIATLILKGFSYLIAFAGQFLILTFFLACLYPFLIGFAAIYIAMVFSALYAQAYVEGAEKMAESSGQPVSGLPQLPQ